MIVIAGSPRKGMYSDRIAEHFASLTNAQVFYARKLSVGPCKGCGYCKGIGKGSCVQKDDMPSILSAFRASDGLVLVSPVYWWQTTAQIKLIIDRFYALAPEDYKGKKLVVIMNGEAEDSDAEYMLLSKQFREMAEYLGVEYHFLGVGTPEGKEDSFREVLDKVKKFASDTCR